MSKFCQICDVLLSRITQANDFYFKCDLCQKKYDITDEDTLLFEDIQGTNYSVYAALLRHARHDPANPKVFRQCSKCPNNICKQVRLGDEMKLINICIECNEQWIESGIANF